MLGTVYYDKDAVAYAPCALKYAADEAADDAREGALYVSSGGIISASATQGKLDKAAGVDFVSSLFATYAAETAKPGCLTAISTTVAAGSNGQTVSGLTSGQLVVGSTGGGAPASGLLAVVRSGAVISCAAYTSIVDGTHFGGVSLVSGWTNITFANATDTVVVINNDLTKFTWLNVELDSSGNYQSVLGTAGGTTTALKPSLTSSRVLHASLLLQPVSGNTSALSIDELITNANGKSKLMQCRRLVTPTPGTILGTKVFGPGTVTTYTVGTTLAALDTTNATLAFNVPASGIVDIEVQTYAQLVTTSAAGLLAFGLLNHSGGAQVGTTADVLAWGSASASSQVAMLRTVFHLTGLTPGALQLDLAANRTGSTGNAASIFAEQVTGNGSLLSAAPLVMRAIASV